MWIVLGGLAVLGVLVATSRTGSPREASPPAVKYRVHSHRARDGYLSDVGFDDEQKARDYAHREASHTDKVAMGTFVDGKFGTLIFATPADYNPFK